MSVEHTVWMVYGVRVPSAPDYPEDRQRGYEYDELVTEQEPMLADSEAFIGPRYMVEGEVVDVAPMRDELRASWSRMPDWLREHCRPHGVPRMWVVGSWG